MKYMNKLTWSLILCTGLFTACSDDDEPVGPGEIAVDKTEIAVGPEGGSELIEVTTPDSWVAQVAAPWVMVSPANGNGSMESKVNIDATLDYQSRSAELMYCTVSGKSQTVTITQLGYGKQIYVKEDGIEVESSADYEKRLVDFTITANVECKIDKVEYEFETNGVELTEAEKAEAEKEKDGWLVLKKNEMKLEGHDLGIVLDEGSRPRTVKLNCRWNMNIVPWVRVAKIYLVAKNPDDQLVNDKGENIDHVILTVKQKAAMKIEDNRAGDSLAIVLINEKVRSMYPIETSENMRNWTGVTLWEETDEIVPEAVGRVRSVAFSMVNIADGDVLPREVRYLKYLESFSIASNDNSQIRNVKICDELCNLEHLKSLTVKAYGLQELPNSFKNLKSLEVLDLSFNCFTSLDKLTQIINKTNFPKMRKLHLYGQRRNDVITDLEASSKDNYQYNGYPLGLHFKMHGSGPDDPKETNAFLQLLTWEELEALELSYCFMEGTLPTDKQMEEYFTSKGITKLHYSADDFSENKEEYLTKLVGDTCKWLLTDKAVTRKNADNTNIDGATVKGNEVLRVLPRARAFSLNLNFFTGELPNWILFHPHFVEWRPTALIFNQQEKGKNSDGEAVGFSNIDADNYNFSYYYGAKPDDDKAAYPKYYSLYVASTGDQEEETISIPYRRR